jgi:hypothetical protein
VNRKRALLVIPIAILCQSGSLVLGKFAALQMAGYTPYDFATNLCYLGSLACLGVQALVWPLALRALPLFWSYLFMSAIYLVIPVVSRFVFHEQVTIWNAAGSLVITAGIVCLCAGKPREPAR